MQAFEFKSKKKKLNLTGYQSNRPVIRSNRPVSRSEPVEHAILNITGSTGFRSNRSDKQLPDHTDLTGPIGNVNSGQHPGAAERRPEAVARGGQGRRGQRMGAVILLLSRSCVPFRFGTPLVPHASIISCCTCTCLCGQLIMAYC